jgi:hypothetical protein
LRTYSDIFTPNKTRTSLFNFFYNSSSEKPGVVVYNKNNTDTLFKIERNVNSIHVGTPSTGKGKRGIKINSIDVEIYFISNLCIFNSLYRTYLSCREQ